MVGHSWGTYVNYEIAKNIASGVDRMVALDPAAEALNYADSGVVFSSVSRYSMAFYSSILGSQSRSLTCDDSFDVVCVGEGDKRVQHRVAHLAFASLLMDNDPLTRLVKSVLLSRENPLWAQNPDNFHMGTHYLTGTKPITFVGLVNDGFEGQLQATKVGGRWHYAWLYYESIFYESN